MIELMPNDIESTLLSTSRGKGTENEGDNRRACVISRHATT